MQVRGMKEIIEPVNFSETSLRGLRNIQLAQLAHQAISKPDFIDKVAERCDSRK